MTDLIKTTIYFNGNNSPLTVLLSEDSAVVVSQCVVQQTTAYNIATLNWVTGERVSLLVINGRNVDYMTNVEYDLEKEGDAR